MKLSALGFGTMRMPMRSGKPMSGDVDEAQAVAMIRHAIDCGVNYIDTAYRYHEGNSELVVAKALADGYREKVYLADKLPVWAVNEPDDFDRILQEQMEKCGTDHIDFYLFHAINAERFREKVLGLGLIEKMKQAKADGRISYIGFSFHDQLPVFQEILDATDAWDFCQIQLNYVDTEYQAGLAGMKMAAQRGMGVIVMEPLLGGKLANPEESWGKTLAKERPAVQWALDWLWTQKEVGTVLSGMSSMKEVQENLSYADQGGVDCLSAAEQAMLETVRKAYLDTTRIPCTSCKYCLPCPQNIEIPELFAIYNGIGNNGRSVLEKQYQTIAVKASACVGCKQCEEACPQMISVCEELEKIKEYFE